MQPSVRIDVCCEVPSVLRTEYWPLLIAYVFMYCIVLYCYVLFMSDEVMLEWRRLHSEALMIFTLHQIFGGIKSRRMGWSAALTRTGEKRGANRVLVNLRERNHLEDQSVDGSLGSRMVVYGRDLSCSQ